MPVAVGCVTSSGMRVLNNEVVMAVILVGILAIFVMRAIVHVVR